MLINVISSSVKQEYRKNKNIKKSVPLHLEWCIQLVAPDWHYQRMGRNCEDGVVFKPNTQR